MMDGDYGLCNEALNFNKPPLVLGEELYNAALSLIVKYADQNEGITSTEKTQLQH